MTFRMTVTGTGQGFGRFSVLAAAERWADEVAPLVRAEIRDRTPVAQAPGGGRLRDSVRYLRFAVGNTLRAEFLTDVPYAKYVVEGTPPHIIRPRNAQALRWMNRSQEPVFARQVNHPGTSPNDFPRRAVQPLLPMLSEKFAEVVEQMIKESGP